MANPRVGDVGYLIRIQFVDEAEDAINISTATVKEIVIRYPDGTTLEREAEFSQSGSDGRIEYATIAEDMPVVGRYEIQGHAVWSLGAYDKHTESGVFFVEEALS